MIFLSDKKYPKENFRSYVKLDLDKIPENWIRTKFKEKEFIYKDGIFEVIDKKNEYFVVWNGRIIETLPGKIDIYIYRLKNPEKKKYNNTFNLKELEKLGNICFCKICL